MLANSVNRELGNPVNNCIAVSLALSCYLERAVLVEARPERVSAAFHPDGGPRTVGIILGHESSRSVHGGWAGHLVVRAGAYILDPTFDQAGGEPCVFRVPEHWDDESRMRPAGTAFMRNKNNDLIRFNKFHRQNGWKSTPIARQWGWKPIYDEMI